MALTDKLGNIADAIREKTGSTGSFTLDAMPSAIRSIETGGGSSGGDNALLRSVVDGSVTAIAASDLAGIKTVKKSAFEMCSYLETVELPSGVTSIDDKAFSGCQRLKTVILPNSVKTIGAEAFNMDMSLESITLGTGLTTIYAGAFQYCMKLKDVYYRGTQEQWAAISKYADNTELTNATIHYNS